MPRKWRVLTGRDRAWLLDVSRSKTLAFSGEMRGFVERTEPAKGTWFSIADLPYVPAELLLTDKRISELDRL